MTLYEIDSALLDCVDQESGEIIDEEKLNALVLERNVKIENVALWVKNLLSDAAAIKAERDALDKRMKAAEKKAESLKSWLDAALSASPFETSRVKITFRRSTTTETDNDALAKKWCVKKITYTPDKAAIKAALLSGKKIKGACLVEHQNIHIN